ncbi:MFS transporter [Alphaproteobacteria bacterium HT1-32]|nr:MFS transporter [Alphaproteobacteria bacterium HT1-32]
MRFVIGSASIPLPPSDGCSVMPLKLSPLHLIIAVCIAHVLSMSSMFAFVALIDVFEAAWGISQTESGLISGVFFVGYIGGGLLLVTRTDSIDPKRIYLFSTGIAALSAVGFGLIASGLVSALILHAVLGFALAGSYMPGLKCLTDKLEGARQSRAVAIYTSSFGVGTAVSYFLAGRLNTVLGWEMSFILLSAGSVLAFLIVLIVVPPIDRERTPVRTSHSFDFMPVLRARRCMAYIICYLGHNWELFGFRSRMVVFTAFAFVTGSATGGEVPVRATDIAGIISLVALPASVIGNEIAIRIGRRRWLLIVMTSSAIAACFFGFSANLSPLMVVAALVIYAAFIAGDSSAITSGMVANAPPGYAGAAMALHTSLGFVGSAIGPIAFGLALDLSGNGATVMSWVIGFAAMGLGVIIGPVALLIIGERKGDPVEK